VERIRATEVLFDSDDETHWAQWLWPQGGLDFEQGYLVFERAVEPDGPEWDCVWCSRCGQGYSCYNGIAQVTLHRAEVVVTFNEMGKQELACDDLIIEFDLIEAEFGRLSKVLQLVFAGTNQFVIDIVS
jgi:Immunity protein 10